jgi:hypothetical protein
VVGCIVSTGPPVYPRTIPGDVQFQFSPLRGGVVHTSIEQNLIGTYLELEIMHRVGLAGAKKNLNNLFLVNWFIALRACTPNIVVFTVVTDIQCLRVIADTSDGLLYSRAAAVG